MFRLIFKLDGSKNPPALLVHPGQDLHWAAVGFFSNPDGMKDNRASKIREFETRYEALEFVDRHSLKRQEQLVTEIGCAF